MALLITLNPILPILLLSISIFTSARELRPSEHGLSNQTNPPSSSSPSSSSQFQSFFNSTTNSDVSVVALPKPTDSTDPNWWKKSQDESTRRKQRGGILLKKILLITSVVCGIAGAVFLLSAVAVYVFRFRRIGIGCRNEGAGLSRSAQLVVK